MARPTITLSLSRGRRSSDVDQGIPAGYRQTEVGVIPEDWLATTLNAVATKITDGDHATPTRTKHGYYLLSARNVTNGHLDLSDVDYVGAKEFERMQERCDPEPGDILISCSGTIGRVAIVPVDIHCVLVRSVALVKPNNNAAYGKFVQYWLQGCAAQQQIAISVNQGAQPNLFLNHIERLQLPVPQMDEQRAIADALGDVDALLGALDRLIAKQRDLKQAAMQQLLTGRTRLPGFTGEWVTWLLGDVARIKTGSRNNENKVDGGPYPFFVRSEVVERIDTYAYDCEAILVPGEGRIGDIFHYVKGRFDVHQRVYAITDFAPSVQARFVHFYLAQYFGPWAMQNTVKATVDSLRLPTFQNFEMHIPPTVAEQIAIAAVLSDMNAEIAALEARRMKTRDLRQAMMQELLTGKTRLI